MKSSLILSNDDVSLICLELSSMLSTGMPLSYGLSAMSEDKYTSGAKELFQGMAEAIEGGATFAEALEQASCFPEHMVRTVRFGEKTGHLEDALLQLHEYYENEQNMRDNIKNALFYPFIMVVLMLVVMFIIITKVIPVFSDVLRQLGASVSAGFQLLLQISGFLDKFAIAFIVVFGVLLFITLIILKVPSLEKFRNSLYQGLINRSKMGYAVNVSRFTSALSTCIASGMSIDEALDIAMDLSANKKLRKQIDRCKEMLADGETGFEKAITESGIISGYYARMISIGFQTGTSEKMLSTISDRYAEKAEERISGFVNVLEPTLIIILSLMVGVILLVSIIPILGILSSL